MANSSMLIGVVGAGTMGSGIALAALSAGCVVYLQDTVPQSLEKAEQYIQTFLEKKNNLQLQKNLHLIGSLDSLSKCEIVVEAASENRETKNAIFQKLDAVCAEDAILATNTSTLSVTGIAAATRHPDRVAGMHFFNPAPVLPLVEIVRGAQTNEATITKLVEFAETLGKTPVVTGDIPGFIVNRVARPFYGEALRLLGEGVANHETIDRIVEQGAGFKMGPFRLMDLIGIDINAGAMRSMYEQTFGEPRYKPHWLQMQKLAEGALGKKTGRGFYEYKDEVGVMRDGETNAEGRSQQAEDRKEQSTIAQPGHVLISDGTWAPGLAELFKGAGYELDSEAEPGEIPAAGFVVAGRSEDAERLLASYDQSLRPDVPLFVQCADIAFSEAARWVEHSSRMIGFDGLFLSGAVVTLIGSGSLSSEIKASCEAIFHHVGKHIVWVNESPAMVLPRIVCQLVNEAAFAELEAVGDRATIDLAMKLGVSYPLGPLEWGEAIGYGKVLAVLDHLVDEYHEERYRACVLLRRLARQ